MMMLMFESFFVCLSISNLWCDQFSSNVCFICCFGCFRAIVPVAFLYCVVPLLFVCYFFVQSFSSTCSFVRGLLLFFLLVNRFLHHIFLFRAIQGFSLFPACQDGSFQDFSFRIPRVC